MQPFLYCQQAAAPIGSLLHYACRRLPQSERDIVYGIFALYQHLQDSWLKVSDPSVAEHKLHWWQQQITLCQTAQANHPCLQLLQPYLLKVPETLNHLHTINAALIRRNQMPAIIQHEADAARFRQQQWPCVFAMLNQLLSTEDYNVTFPATFSRWYSALSELNEISQYSALQRSPFSLEHLQAFDIQNLTITGDQHDQWSKFILAQLHSLQHSVVELPQQAPLFLTRFASLQSCLLQKIQRKPLQILTRPATISPLRALWCVL